MTGPFRPPTGMQPGSAPGQGGQPAVHPTVGDFGLPGGQVTIERPRYVPPPNVPQQQNNGGWVMPPVPAPVQGTFDQSQQPQGQPQFQQPQQQPQQPQFQPHPTAQFGQQPPQQQPQQQPQGYPQNAPAQRVSIPDHVIMDGESVPPELRGRSWGQVKQIYGALANDFLMRQPNRQQPQQQPQGRDQVYVQGEPNGGVPQRGGRPQGPPQGAAASGFWADPEGTIQRIVEGYVAPITQRTTAMAIQEARQIAAAGIPDFHQLEGEIMQSLAGADPTSLTDPRMWQNIADLARGRLMSRGQYDPRQVQQPQGQPQQNGGYPVPGQRGPGSFVPAPVNPVGQFFTEAPTPPQYDGQQGGGMNNYISAEEHEYAQKMQMSDEQYVAWRGGVVRQTNSRRY
jgi:hypothetical protein